MKNSIEFKLLNEDELVKKLGSVQSFTVKYPKAPVTPVNLKTQLETWQSKLPPLAEPVVKMGKIAGIPLKAKEIDKLRAINLSATPTAEAVVNQKLSPDEVIGTLFSSLNTLEFTKMESEYKTRIAAATTPATRLKVQTEWNAVLKAGQQAFASGTVKGLKEADLRKFSQELVKTKDNFDAVVRIANTGVALPNTSGEILTASTVSKGGWVPETGNFADDNPTLISIPSLCSTPFAVGSYTKSFSRSFALRVRLRVWCPKWYNPFNTCVKTFTIAAASFSLSLQVGYRVTCCGATVWGQASAQACGTILGITICAGCTARITGVAGIGRSSSGSNCTYGIGVNARLSCTLAGFTVFNVQVPFGFNINGPCPPAGFCN